MKKYYVYEWFDLKNDMVFYVGKGTGRRYLVKKRNKEFNQYIKNNDVDVRIIKYFNNENESFLFEEKLISEYKSIGQCFCNLYFGGNGGVSEVWTKEMKQKMSIYNPMKDKEQRQRMSDNNPMKDKKIAKRVSDKKRKIPIINGIEYKTVEEASIKNNVCITTIWRWCKRGYDTLGNPCNYKNEPLKQNNFKITNSKKILIDGIEFRNVKEGSKYIGVWSESLIRAIKNNRKCKGHICSYANQQLS